MIEDFQAEIEKRKGFFGKHNKNGSEKMGQIVVKNVKYFLPLYSAIDITLLSPKVWVILSKFALSGVIVIDIVNEVWKNNPVNWQLLFPSSSIYKIAGRMRSDKNHIQTCVLCFSCKL